MRAFPNPSIFKSFHSRILKSIQMTHNETTAILIDRLGWPQPKVNELMQATAEAMGEHLSEPGTLSLPGVGRLISRKQREYISLNPETGERHLMPPAVELLYRLSLKRDQIDVAPLVSLLRKKHPEISDEDAGRLQSEWLTLVSESILREESIEIPHIGTFQCKPLSEASHDEERFLITFNPSALLRRGVNSYFAHFEPTLLNEGITFDELVVVKMGEENIATDNDNVIVRESVTPALHTAEQESLPESLPEPEEAPAAELPEPEEAPTPPASEQPLETAQPDEPGPPLVSAPNPLFQSLRHLPDEATRQRVVDRGSRTKRGRKSSSVWVPIIGGVAIVVAGLFFFNRDTTER